MTLSIFNQLPLGRIAEHGIVAFKPSSGDATAIDVVVGSLVEKASKSVAFYWSHLLQALAEQAHGMCFPVKAKPPPGGGPWVHKISITESFEPLLRVRRAKTTAPASAPASEQKLIISVLPRGPPSSSVDEMSSASEHQTERKSSRTQRQKKKKKAAAAATTAVAATAAAAVQAEETKRHSTSSLSSPSIGLTSSSSSSSSLLPPRSIEDIMSVGGLYKLHTGVARADIRIVRAGDKPLMEMPSDWPDITITPEQRARFATYPERAPPDDDDDDDECDA